MTKRRICPGLVAGLLVLLAVPRVSAQGHRFGAGISFDRSIPVMGLGDRYPATQKYGLMLDYRTAPKTTLEFEYNHALLSDGKIERMSFTWPGDKEKYLSPQARSEMKLNSFLVNALIRLDPADTSDTGMQLVPYLAIGAGFYAYHHRVSGLIYPGQQGAALNPDLLLEPQEDAHVSLGANFGVGMTVVRGHFGLDARARYHLILGNLRPMEAWGLKSVFPMGMVDVRTAFKFYFR